MDSTFRSAAYARETTPMRTLRDVCIRGLSLPCTSGHDARRLVHSTQCVLARVWARHLHTQPKSWRWYITQVGVSLNY